MNDTISRNSADTGGTEITRFNALRHGLLSRYTVLPWEDADEYRARGRRTRGRAHRRKNI